MIKRICFMGLSLAFTSAAISSIMTALPVASASAVPTAKCIKVIAGEVSSWEQRSLVFRRCKQPVLGVGGFAKVLNPGVEVVPGVVCYKVAQAIERSGWEDPQCLTAKAATGLYVKVVAGGKEEEEEGTEVVGVLLLSGESFPVTFKSKSGKTTIETLGKKSIACTEDSASGELESGSGGSVTIDSTGCKLDGEVACRSENASGEKDAIETILETNAQLLAVNMLNSKKELVGGVATALPEAVKVRCGLLKVEIRGIAVGLFAPINKEISTTESTTLELKQKEGDIETGSCTETKAVCEQLAKEPLEAKLAEKFEDAAEQTTETITFSKMIEFVA